MRLIFNGRAKRNNRAMLSISTAPGEATLLPSRRKRAQDRPAPTAATGPLQPAGEGDFFTQSPAMQRVLGLAWRAAAVPATILLLGEHGTGKSRLARAIHARSPRGPGPFITVNCPCLQSPLLESDLFGHVRGAYTGAVTDAAGRVAAAEHGTLFLDEMGELPPEIQPKLLRLLQERCYERVGDSRLHQADIRIIAATNRDLRAEVAAGRFREDLYYRINGFPLTLPPLRARREDILPAAEQFLADVDRTLGRCHAGFTAEAREILHNAAWPGNLRELHNVIERCSILCDRPWLDAADLIGHFPPVAPSGPGPGELVPLQAVMAAHIRLVVERTGSLQEAARILGVNPSTLYRHRFRRRPGGRRGGAGPGLAAPGPG